MADKKQIKSFLDSFRACWPPRCFVVSRSKNNECLAKLELTPKQRRDIILGLSVQDYVGGPLSDEGSPGESVWIFGKKVEGTELYVKLKVYKIKGKRYGKCLSCHESDAPLKYPYK